MLTTHEQKNENKKKFANAFTPNYLLYQLRWLSNVLLLTWNSTNQQSILLAIRHAFQMESATIKESLFCNYPERKRFTEKYLISALKRTGTKRTRARTFKRQSQFWFNGFFSSIRLRKVRKKIRKKENTLMCDIFMTLWQTYAR